MKKFFLILLAVLAVLIITYVVINLFDTSLKEGAYTESQIIPASVTASNGFVIFWGLPEEADVDILSDAFIGKVREIYTPPPSEDQAPSPFEKPAYRRGYSVSEHRRKFKHYTQMITKVKFPNSFEQSWVSAVRSHKARLESIKKETTLLMKRYRRLIDFPECLDATPLLPYSPLPDILGWLKTDQLYTALCVVDALEGNWEKAVEDLFAKMSFARKLIGSARTVYFNMMARNCISRSLQALVDLMNHPDCPRTIYSNVLSRMTPLKYEEYGNRYAYIAECLMFFNVVDILSSGDRKDWMTRNPFIRYLPMGIFMQKNRTKNFYQKIYSVGVSYDEKAPYLWTDRQASQLRRKSRRLRGLWWLRNPMGNYLFTWTRPHLSRSIMQGYNLKAYYGMVRLAAELHLKYTPGHDVLETLKGLDGYKSIDPYSGKPFRWNSEKSCIYSLGFDGKDQQGAVKVRRRRGTDLAIKVVFKGRKKK